MCVLDAAGKIAARFTIEYSGDGIAALARRLARYREVGGMPVAIERLDGRLVELLLEARRWCRSSRTRTVPPGGRCGARHHQT